MAALLRSARLLKYKPPCLLQITGAKSPGVPLARPYSGATGARKFGVGPRQLFPALENAPSRLLPYTAMFGRNFAVATEMRDESGAALQSQQARHFDWSLNKLDTSVKKTGRIPKTLLLRIFHDTCRNGYPSGNQALLLLRSCGSLLPEVSLADRTELAHHIWEKLKELGVQYDVSHYNALLKVYLQNEFKFSPMDFLAKMEAANILPNRVTYQRLIASYCQNGDIDGASAILGFMKSKGLAITELVFNSLITGHARTGDIESAKNILTVMKNAGIEPSPDTYVSLLNAYAQNGDMENVKASLGEAESADCNLLDRDIMQVIFTLAKAGYSQHVPELIARMKHERGYIPDAMNLCLSLITQGHEDVAFHVLKSFSMLRIENGSDDSLNHGNFFLRHCVNMGMSVEKIGQYCKELQEVNLHASPLTFVLACALEAKNMNMSLEIMKMMKDQNIPLRPHFFWPLLVAHVNNHDTAAVLEVVKAMDSLGVIPDSETLLKYVIPAFPSIKEAQESLKEASITLNSDALVTSKIRLMTDRSLASLYTFLSDESSPKPELATIRSTLIIGFIKSSDVESMVKITELLFKNQDFCRKKSNPIEETSYFLYNMIDSMSPEEVQLQEDKLRQYFNQLQEQNIIITSNIFRGIQKLLEAYNVPELINDVFALVPSKERFSNNSSTAVRHLSDNENMLVTLENQLDKLKSRNEPFSNTLKKIMIHLSAHNNLQRALELKQQYEAEMTPGAYAVLINLCCRLNNVEEALNLKRELSRVDPSVALDGTKYLELVKTLTTNGKSEEAVDILKEMKEKNVVLSDYHFILLFHVVCSVKGADNIRHLLDSIFTLGLSKPTANLCSPLVGAYLESNDLHGALDAVIECNDRYKNLPRIHDVMVGLMEQGDTEALQKAMDFLSEKRGEMIMLYELFFAFLETGRYREARKIIETPGIRARPARLQWFAERCINLNKMEILEQMVEITSNLFECDRDEMYSYLLRLCKVTNDWQKAEAVWTKMQEENVIPRENTLHLLADILKSNGQEVPFEVPETWYKHSNSPDPVDNGSVNVVKLLSLCKKGRAREAYGLLKDINEKGVSLSLQSYDVLIRSLLAEGEIEDAMVVKNIATSRHPSFKLSDNATNLLIVTQSKKGKVEDALATLKSKLQRDQMPSRLAVTNLLHALGSKGDVATIQEVDTLMKGLHAPLSLSNIMFINHTVLAHISNGDLDLAAELMESVYTSPENVSPSMSVVFKKVLENGNDKALDKLSAVAERLANHFACYRPAADLFIELLDQDKVEDAKFMLARCNAVAEQRDLLVWYVSKKAQKPGQINKIKTLMHLIPDFMEKEVLYTYLMKCHELDNDLESAKALMEQMQKEGVEVNELSLKRLASLYHQAGETVPFPEPQESYMFYAKMLKDKLSKTQITEE